MLGVDDARLGDEVPRGVGALFQLQHPIVLDHRRAAFLRRSRISPDRSCGVDVSLAVRPHAPKNALHTDDRAAGLALLRRPQADVIDTDRLEAARGRLQPFPALPRRSDMNATG